MYVIYHHLLTYLMSFSIAFHTFQDGTCSMSFRIPWTKTTKKLGAIVVLTVQANSTLCAIAALKNHLSVNSSIPSSSALFAYTTPSREPKNLLRHDFLKFVTDIWSSAMLVHVLGHSFQIGGMVELLLAGVPPEVVQPLVAGHLLLFFSIGIIWRKFYP